MENQQIFDKIVKEVSKVSGVSEEILKGQNFSEDDFSEYLKAVGIKMVQKVDMLKLLFTLGEVEIVKDRFVYHKPEYSKLVKHLVNFQNTPIFELKTVYIIMSPGGGIGLDISTSKGECYTDLVKAEKELKSKNEWSKSKGYGTYELVTLEVKSWKKILPRY